MHTGVACLLEACVIAAATELPSQGVGGGDVFGLPIETWDVIGTIVTALAFLAAAVGAWAAYGQLRSTEATRLDQNRPYVLVTADNNPTAFHIIDLIVENVGAGPARDVVIKIDPPLRRVREDADYKLAESRLFTEPIPVLPPGFKLRTFFDSAIDRNGADVPKSHRVTITYNDGHGHKWTESSVLDFNLLEGLLYTETYNTHHVAAALRDMKNLLDRSKLLKGDGVHAIVETRDEYNGRLQARREEHERMTAEWERQRQEQRGATEAQADVPS